VDQQVAELEWKESGPVVPPAGSEPLHPAAAMARPALAELGERAAGLNLAVPAPQAVELRRLPVAARAR